MECLCCIVALHPLSTSYSGNCSSLCLPSCSRDTATLVRQQMWYGSSSHPSHTPTSAAALNRALQSRSAPHTSPFVISPWPWPQAEGCGWHAWGMGCRPKGPGWAQGAGPWEPHEVQQGQEEGSVSHYRLGDEGVGSSTAIICLSSNMTNLNQNKTSCNLSAFTLIQCNTSTETLHIWCCSRAGQNPSWHGASSQGRCPAPAVLYLPNHTHWWGSSAMDPLCSPDASPCIAPPCPLRGVQQEGMLLDGSDVLWLPWHVAGGLVSSLLSPCPWVCLCECPTLTEYGSRNVCLCCQRITELLGLGVFPSPSAGLCFCVTRSHRSLLY